MAQVRGKDAPTGVKTRHDRVHTEHDEPEDFDVYYSAYGSNMKVQKNTSERKLNKTTNRSLEQFSRVRDYTHFERVKSK